MLSRIFVYFAIWCVLEYIFWENIYEYLSNMDMGSRARVGARPSTQSPGKQIIFVILWPFCYLFSMLGLFCNVFLLIGGLFTMWEPFCYFFSKWGAFFVLRGILFGLPIPPLTKIFVGAHEYRYAIAAH